MWTEGMANGDTTGLMEKHMRTMTVLITDIIIGISINGDGTATRLIAMILKEQTRQKGGSKEKTTLWGI